MVDIFKEYILQKKKKESSGLECLFDPAVEHYPTDSRN